MKPFDRGSETKQQYQHFQQSSRWEDFRETVFIRDNYTCRICRSKQYLEPHHIRYKDAEGYTDWANPDNAVTLCRQCHQIITWAVERARCVKPRVIGNAVNFMDYAYKTQKAAYGDYKEIIVDTIFDLWKRSLKEDAGWVNFRKQDNLEEIGEIVVDTLKEQASITSPYNDNFGYIMSVQSRITEAMAEAYNEYAAQGFDDQAIRCFLKLDADKLYKVKENAGRLVMTGTLRMDGKIFDDGAGGSG